MTKETLHLYRDEGGNVYAARDLAHAKELCAKDIGNTADVSEEWESIPDERELTIRDDDEGTVTKRAGDWANEAHEPGCIGGSNH